MIIHYYKNDTLTSSWAWWRLKLPAFRLFDQLFVQAQIKKHQSSASLAFMRGNHRWPVVFPHKRPITRKIFSFDDVIVCRPGAMSKMIQSEKSLQKNQSIIQSFWDRSHMAVCLWSEHINNPLHVIFFSEGTKHIYLYFMSFLHSDMRHVAEILPQVR